jgi:hypothetical protein
MGVNSLMLDDDYRVATAGSPKQVDVPQAEGWFDNFFPAVGTSIVGGAAAVTRTFDRIAADSAMQDMQLSLIANNNFLPDEFRQYATVPKPVAPLDEELKRVQDWAKIDPRETGPVGQAVGSVAHGLTVFGLSSLLGGSVAGTMLTGATEGMTAYEEAKASGLDDATAMRVATASGIFSAAGTRLSFGAFGDTLLSKMLIGGGVNTGFGYAQRAITSAVLQDAGYKEMAEQYRPLDRGSLVADYILGAAFGGWEHFWHRGQGSRTPAETRPNQTMVDEALETRRQDMQARGAAGIPTTPETAALDQELQDRALGNLLRGEPNEITGDEADTIAKGALSDPEKVQLNTDIVNTGKELFGPVADFTEPPKTKAEPAEFDLGKVLAEGEAKPAEQAPEAKPEVKAPAGEPAAPAIYPHIVEQIRQMATDHPDMKVMLPDGKTEVPAAELETKLNEEMDQAKRDSILHDVAAACILGDM